MQSNSADGFLDERKTLEAVGIFPYEVALQPEPRVEFLSDALADLLGCAPADLAADPRRLLDLIDPGKRRNFDAGSEDIATTLETPVEISVQLPGGRTRLLRHSAMVSLDEAGLPTRIRGVVLEVSSQTQLSQDLQESEQRYRALVETSPDGLFVMRDGSVLYANEACLQLLGVRLLSEIRGMSLQELVEDLEADSLAESVAAVEGEVAWRRVRAKRVDQGDHFLELALINGEFVGAPALFGILRDVSMQVQFQHQLEYRLAFEGLMCQISTQFINVRAGAVDKAVSDALEQLGRFADVDRCFLTMITPDLHRVTNGYAWARDGVDAHDDIMLDDSLQDYPYAAHCLLEIGLLHVPSVADLPAEAAVERVLFERQGVLSTIVLPLYSEGAWRGFFGFETVRAEREWSGGEISALRLAAQVFSYAINRKHAEEERQNLALQMQTAQKMESLGVLVGGVAHDFNNLLTGIMGNAALVLHEVPPGSTAHECVGEMERAAKHAAQLVRQMLIYAGRGKASKRHLDMNHLVEDIGRLLRTSISKKSELHFELDDEPCFIEADETQLRQIVMNLITNASQAIGAEAGSIHLRTGTRALEREELRRLYLGSEAEPGPFAFVEVEDTGCGMTADVVERMFDPFFTSKPTGTGLGLAATLGIVRAHCGVIEVDTAPERGARIAVFFPLASADPMPLVDPPEAHSQADSPARAAATQVSAGQGLVLVVDDEPVVRTVARRILERGGYTVIDACDGKVGVERFEENRGRIRAIVLDMAMPVMDGEQAFQAIRDMGPPVPVVLSSGFLPRDTIDRLLQEPDTAFVAKPYRPSRLLEVMEDLLANHPPPSETD